MDLNGFEFLLNGFEWIWWRVVSGEGLGGWVWVVVRGEVVRGGAAGGAGGEGMGKTHKMRDLEFARRSIGSTGSHGSRTLAFHTRRGPGDDKFRPHADLLT